MIQTKQIILLLFIFASSICIADKDLEKLLDDFFKKRELIIQKAPGIIPKLEKILEQITDPEIQKIIEELMLKIEKNEREDIQSAINQLNSTNLKKKKEAQNSLIQRGPKVFNILEDMLKKKKGLAHKKLIEAILKKIEENEKKRIKNAIQKLGSKIPKETSFALEELRRIHPRLLPHTINEIKKALKTTVPKGSINSVSSLLQYLVKKEKDIQNAKKKREQLLANKKKLEQLINKQSKELFKTEAKLRALKRWFEGNN